MDRRKAAPAAGGRPPHPARDAGVGTDGRRKRRFTPRALKRGGSLVVRVSGVKQQMLTGRQTLTKNWKREAHRCLGQRARRGVLSDTGVLGRGRGHSEEGEDSFSERAGGVRPTFPQTSLGSSAPCSRL